MTEGMVIAVGVLICCAYCAGVFVRSAFDRFAERMREDIEQTMRDLEGKS
jgi:uncharacterized membrane protein (DUF485 family)